MIAAPSQGRSAGGRPAATASILMIDDHPGDAELMRIAVEMSALDVQLAWVRDGYAAFRELQRCRTAGCLPELILLDLNMPCMNGAEVLARLQADGITAQIPVVMLSTSGWAADRTRLVQAGASEFLLKPDGIQDLVALAGRLMMLIGAPAP